MSDTEFRLPRAYGSAVLEARFRQSPEDFFVEELPAFAASGEGEHLLLTIEKRGQNTAFVAKRLAQWSGIAEMGIGYAGLKDRHAVTRQRFSVHLPKKIAPDTAELQGDDLKILEQHWHQRKLPRGALAGNRFVLVLREVSGDKGAIESRLEAIRDGGVPNYFGEQRFGREAGNIAAARRLFAGERVRRDQRSILLSAARSALFNAVLARRVEQGDWNIGSQDEVWMLDGTHSVFGPTEFDEALQQRMREQDVHPTGPMWGVGELRSAGALRVLEESATAGFLDLRQGLEAAGLKQERRALRMRVPGMQWQWLGDDALQLSFELAPGSYATEVLAELGEVRP